ncbi:MAG: hypothetical protein DSZ07_05990 [Sulfurovum sp.]|nr:MAG: hypothetical protein DSZ07_05990 [Sulfurovum sp.]
MNDILLEQGENTPKVIMNQAKGFIEFKGKSYPENTFAFYRPITEWLKYYFNNYSDKHKVTTVNFKFLYFNSATTQIIFEILDILQDSKVKNMKIYWFYDKDNRNGLEDYEDYSEEFPELHIESKAY